MHYDIILIIILLSPFVIAFGAVNTCDKESKRVKNRNKALQYYVQTGKKTKPYYAASSSAIASANRARVRLINEQRRARENKAIDLGFQAVCECPKCETIDLHWLTGNMAGRQCRKCGYRWHVPT
jgi:hypothetical protein